MPDLRKILFGAKNKDYVDVTRLGAPSKRKAPFVSNAKSGLRLKKKPLKFRLKVIKTKKVKRPKPLLKRKVAVVKKPKVINSFTKSLRPSRTPFVKPVMPSKASTKPQKSSKAVFIKAEVLAGEVTHFFDKIQVCVIKVQNSLKIGDQLHFKGSVTDFSQVLVSMQVDHKPVSVAKKGQEIGLKVKKDVRVGDKVFIV